MNVKFVLLNYIGTSDETIDFLSVISDVDKETLSNKIKRLYKMCKPYSFERLHELIAETFKESSSTTWEKIVFINCFDTYIETQILGGEKFDFVDEYFEWLTVKTYEGNCIDSFINKIVCKKIQTIDMIADNIMNRESERNTLYDYKNTSTFERDYTQIRKIRDEAQKIVDYSNKQLEAMSDNYL